MASGLRQLQCSCSFFLFKSNMRRQTVVKCKRLLGSWTAIVSRSYRLPDVVLYVLRYLVRLLIALPISGIRVQNVPCIHNKALHCRTRLKQLISGSYLSEIHKKLSYRRETARQLPTWRGLSPPVVHSPSPLWLHLCVWSNPKPATNVRQACRP